MSVDHELAALQRDVQYLKDRIAILDCVARHARGCDRHDVDLVCSAYHDDGSDEHGAIRNAGPDYGAWANATHAASSLTHTHNVTTHTCEVDGDVAHAESYVIVILLTHDAGTATVISGRYVDRLERREGEWRIAVRVSTVEVMFSADASAIRSSFFAQQGYPRGTRDRADLSYERPLLADTRAPEYW